MKKNAEIFGSAIFFFGLALIFFIDQISFWPWILALIGISILPSSIIRNRGFYGLMGTLWLVGMAVLFYFDVFWPGILILIGSSILLGILKKEH